ncbi:CaiB/BaiF CoA transferase family protein [Mycolicibacterium confluentis]|uniref:Putative CoA-transferase n=1 Tax=Mycolicibacterium confluentis TaxID=28047 RepID=A0A7I7XXF5_9MYCO|nr:CoA transferase [Mycolicibacterium confluentis]MCV7321691.1 CoA transferase [Mycolicibacterium confluentis]ORV31974.1 acyl-CoA transferase [Mycolicibacterium confluentis]BBZ33502.1 putative CoA-transferase [Mycolicibacterium confluentis]
MADGAELLAGLRVLDLSRGSGDAVGRILGDLGADVIKVEPPGGSPARAELPRLGDTSIAFALHNANKSSVVLDPDQDGDRERLLELVADADILIDSGIPGQAAAYGTSCAALADRFEHLVALSVTDFGTEGPRSSWQATDAVLYALSSALSKSGPPTGMPVLPPNGIASATAAVQAAWAALVAYYHRLRTGLGDYIDFSRYEAVLLALDPPFGSHGQAASAAGGQSKWRGRPRMQDSYPILPCADGWVRMVVLAPRQWHGLRAWLGEPEQFQDPKYDTIVERFLAWGEIGGLLTEKFSKMTMAEISDAGESYGVPVAAVLEPSDVGDSEHFAAVGAFTEAEVVPGVRTRVPVGYYTVDGQRFGFRTAAPAVGAGPGRFADRAARTTRAEDLGGKPFAGLRIVDLGIIVAGGELSRLFGDLGAEIIKVESKQFPDGLRQGRPGQILTESFAWTHRNNSSLGLELRSEGGPEVLAELVRRSDAVFANFKPGTLTGLGFPYEKLKEINPSVVLAESSAFGDTGPWSSRLGYGPLVRACTGVTALWTAPDRAAKPGRHPFYDATTVFPDHVVGRITAIGALAALIHRDLTGEGARIHVSQAEAGINQLDTVFVAQRAQQDARGAVVPSEATDSVFACQGEDEWAVISLRHEADRQAAITIMGDPSGWADWTSARTPAEVAELLQAAGVPAAPMNRRPEVSADPQLAVRGLYEEMTHPLIEAPLPAETGPAPFRRIAKAGTRPAPMPGDDTREIGHDVLGLDDEAIDKLVADGVLYVGKDAKETVQA